jgi:hypothetical protein
MPDEPTQGDGRDERGPSPSQDPTAQALLADAENALRRLQEYAQEREVGDDEAQRIGDADRKRLVLEDLTGDPWGRVARTAEFLAEGGWRGMGELRHAVHETTTALEYQPAYLVGCPFCGAEPLTYCRTRSRTHWSKDVHKARERVAPPPEEVSDLAVIVRDVKRVAREYRALRP